MSRNKVSAKLYVDPNFYIPPGIDERDIIQQDAVDFSFSGDNGSDYDSELSEYFTPLSTDDAGESSESVPVPQNIQILSQTISTSPGGNQVVDVVISIEDIPGIDSFELSLSR